MDVKFSFENAGKGKFGYIRRPVAKVTLRSLRKKIDVDIWMVIDTGADYTIIPRHFASKLRISLERDCDKDSTFGVGGNQVIYFLKEKIEARLGNFSRRIPLAFFDNNEVPALLGRLGFLETFNTEFLKTFSVIFKN
ncbi:MAG: aspartyl protease family protein [Patescibacteria group bacterium]|nr:aspartyl protease family protein [Patescibacteria group bacterium]